MSDAWDSAGRVFRIGRDKPMATTDASRAAHLRVRGDADSSAITHHGGLPLAMRDGMPIEPDHRGSRAVQLRLKRLLIDLPITTSALLLLAPLMLGVALAIRLTSKGPALFTQSRVGMNGRSFRMLKFRTFRIDAYDHAGLNYVVKNDHRVTPIGKLLRATSVDELPQLWNVLVGDMALVGPRPMVSGMRAAGVDYREAVPYYDYRHRVRPGLSGWAQAHGLRGPTDDMSSARQRIDHDCAYVQNFSLALDIRIIVRTIAREFLTGSGV